MKVNSKQIYNTIIYLNHSLIHPHNKKEELKILVNPRRNASKLKVYIFIKIEINDRIILMY